MGALGTWGSWLNVDTTSTWTQQKVQSHVRYSDHHLEAVRSFSFGVLALLVVEAAGPKLHDDTLKRFTNWSMVKRAILAALALTKTQLWHQSHKSFDWTCNDLFPWQWDLILEHLNFQDLRVHDLQLGRLPLLSLNGAIAESQQRTMEQQWLICSCAKGWKAEAGDGSLPPKVHRDLCIDQQTKGRGADGLSCINERFGLLVCAKGSSSSILPHLLERDLRNLISISISEGIRQETQRRWINLCDLFGLWLLLLFLLGLWYMRTMFPAGQCVTSILIPEPIGSEC